MTEAKFNLSADISQHPGWWALLDGEYFDMENLAYSVSQPHLQVRLLDERYYLWADDFQGHSSQQAKDVKRRADDIIRVLNGAAKVQFSLSREVHTNTIVRVRDDGEVEKSYFETLGTARVNLSRLNGTEEPHPTLTERAAAKGITDDDMELALRMFGRDDLDYRDLYFIFEMALEALGDNWLYGEATGITKKETKRFKRTAQSRKALGEEARHGHERTAPPKDPMSFDEAQAFITRVLRAWLAT